MEKNTKKVVAGIFICAVSSTATASNSTNTQSEEAVKMSVYTEVNENNAVYTPTENIKKIKNINLHKTEVLAEEGKRKRHSVQGFIGFWNSLWAKNNTESKHDSKFS